MIELQQIKKQLLSGVSIDEIFADFDWRTFEKAVSEIFTANSFIVKQNLRFKTKSRYEIDLIAARNNLVFCVDCKDWSGGRYKKSALESATDKQKIRVNELRKYFKRNFVAEQILKFKRDSTFLPVVVTLLEEDIVQRDGTFVVPFEKLNTFLLEIEEYI